jgi:hypothetical protein
MLKLPVSGIYRFHHVGILTGNPGEAVNNLRALGYRAGPSVFDDQQDVHLRMCEGELGSPKIEVVTPTKTNLPLSSLLKRKDDFGYHICFEVTSINETIAVFLHDSNQLRFREVSPPKPAILFGGALVAFYYFAGLGIVELLEQK